ncbi:hypothetical protein SAMN05192574_106270 [Mucilaginibacter gossypiicola]|uniref:DUF4412 domain-containing protein n=1 Tax=Mucilaginibacter gossypiicola TaxID=551995 RepID=A0A1H8N6H6_9SPHI|nr:DUF6263 family protein [Mucilaginibacter gossypiicola]SEO25098.1 hypothetical protein SAMN05192574_106270 [Mucilaginibacter gossypiicola]
MKKILFAAVLVIVSVASYAQKVKPVLKLIKGNTYYLATTAHSVVKQTINGQLNSIDMTINGKISFKVLNADDSLYYMEVNYTKVGMQMQLPNGNVAFNSDDKDTTNVMARVMSGITNKPFTATLTKSGRIRSIENAESMITSMIDGFKEVPAEKKEQLKTQLSQSFGSGALKSNLEMAMSVLPEVPVSKNDKWTINNNLQGAMNAKMVSVYQLMDVTPQSFVIHGNATIETDNTADYKIVSNLPMKYNMKGTMVSDIIVDKATGWISSSKVKQSIDGSVAIKDSPQVPGGVTFPMSVTSETSTTNH